MRVNNHTIPRITDVINIPSPIPELSNTPHENHIAVDNVRASSDSESLAS